MHIHNQMSRGRREKTFFQGPHSNRHFIDYKSKFQFLKTKFLWQMSCMRQKWACVHLQAYAFIVITATDSQKKVKYLRWITYQGKNELHCCLLSNEQKKKTINFTHTYALVKDQLYFFFQHRRCTLYSNFFYGRRTHRFWDWGPQFFFGVFLISRVRNTSNLGSNTVYTKDKTAHVL